MADRNELRLMTNVARMYYERDLTQTEIASRLDLSQATVSRLLKRAHAARIVRTTVTVPDGLHSKLEDALQDRFGLRQAIVADCPDASDHEIIRAIGAAGAYYFETTLRPSEIIGVSSWSASLMAMVDQMHPVRGAESPTLVQILGGVGNPSAEMHANRMTDRLGTLLGVRPEYLPAAGIVGSAAARDVLMQDPFMQKPLGLFDRLTMALVGIGAIEPSQMLASSGNVFQPEELQSLQDCGAVGDICQRFYDADGREVAHPVGERVIGIRLDQLRNVRRSIGIAGGHRKVAAIRGALRGRIVNVLITDRFTAEAILA
jgi:DNA-binding transcriptional regulator LsrR (DeoR family)